MEGELPTETLPDELIERIVLMVPFPALFKARWLSKAWQARFSSPSELDDKEMKRLAISFQKQAQSRANFWGTFFPVRIHKESCSAFDWGSRNWVRLPSLSFLPENILESSEFWSQGPNSGLLVTAPTGPIQERLYVANIFTRSYKLLPPYPPSFSVERVFILPRLFRDSPLRTYKVIGAPPETRSRHLRHFLIYESQTDAWRIIKIASRVAHVSFAQLLRSVCLNGVLYTLLQKATPEIPYLPRQTRRFWALNLEDGTCEDDVVCVLNPELPTALRAFSHLLVWNCQLVMVVQNSSNWGTVYKINLMSKELLKVNGGPPDSLNGDFSRGSPECHGNYVFFPGTGRGRVAYNMLENQWSLFEVPPLPRHLGVENIFEYERNSFQSSFQSNWVRRVTPGSFQPGLDPFWAV